MSGFIDLYVDTYFISSPCHTVPRTSTTITMASSGSENRNQNWQHPLRNFQMPEAIREQKTFDALYNHWLIMAGPANTFPFQDPLDYASIDLTYPGIEIDLDMESQITGLDQVLGVGDGVTTQFQITKAYERIGQGNIAYSYVRPIYLPVVDTVDIWVLVPTHDEPVPLSSLGSLDGGPYTVEVSRPGGVVTITPAPREGFELTDGFLFDCEVRFEADDSFGGIVQSYRTSGMASVTFVEVRPC